MHFAVAVVTEEKPTEAMLADILAPFGPAAGTEAKWDWQVLGGRFSGLLGPHGIGGTITSGPECPDDEFYFIPIDDPGPGVDALQNRNLETYYWHVPPRVLVINGQWLEAPPLVVDFGGGLRPFAFYLGDIDPLAPIVSSREVRRADDWFERFYGVLDGLPDDRWISILDCRAPRLAPARQRH
jgi:hypothetical protein